MGGEGGGVNRTPSTWRGHIYCVFLDLFVSIVGNEL